MADGVTLLMTGASVREKDSRQRAELAARLADEAGPRAILLTTCHRVELYSTEPRSDPSLTGLDAFRHLARVAAGLESAVPGEGEVLHQVRDALAGARARGTVDAELARAFELAIAAGRRARAGLGAPPPGVADRAAAWLLEGAPDLRSGAIAVVAGRGRMGRRLATVLMEAGATVVRASRTPGDGILSLAEAAPVALEAAAVAIALAGPWTELVALPRGPVADISWPPALPAALRRDAPPGRLLEIDAVERSAPDPGWTGNAEAAVDGALREYAAWLDSRSSSAIVDALLRRAEARRAERVARTMRRLGQLDQRQAALVEQLSRQLVADVLHEPLSALRAGTGETAVREAFEL